MARVAVLGAGSWGTAVATLLAANGHEVALWCHEPETVSAINKGHENTTFLPGVTLSDAITATGDINEVVGSCDVIFEAIPVPFLRTTLSAIEPQKAQQKLWVTLSKGIEQDTLMFPTQILQGLFSQDLEPVVVSGPNFAKDLAAQAVTATTVACLDEQNATRVAQLLRGDFFMARISDDPIGAQVGGALKNVITLTIGILCGAQMPENTRAFVFTQGLAELALIAKACGGRVETLYDLAGIGDLVLTALGTQSRNMKCGILIGQGQSLSQIESKLSLLPEGVNTAQSVHQLAKRQSLELTVCQGTYQMLFEGLSVDAFVAGLALRYNSSSKT